MKEVCILFLYHAGDAVTCYHYEQFRKTGYPVVPLTDGGSCDLPGTVDVGGFENNFPWSTHNKWASIDTVVYRWFEERRLPAERYVIVEWDCLLLGSLREYYGAYWDRPFVSNYVKRMGRDSWYWFKHSPKGLPDDKNLGVVPFAGILVRHEALQAVCRFARSPELADAFCENRIAVSAAMAGIEISDMRKQYTLHSSRRTRYPGKPGLYHAVKRLPES